ncbi:MAG: alkaline phosphatase [Bacteroidetes bacterium]|nr:alkaline phosphatase [Bacteroidota bacterium]
MNLIDKKNIKVLFISIAIVAITGMSFSCSQSISEDNNNEKYSGKHAKYVFYFIGDGMGLTQINSAENYMAALQGEIGVKRLSISKLATQGYVTTYAQNRYITGSAAAGTALATGHKTSISTISMDGDHQNKLKTVAEMAKEKGMKVGIITTVDIDHATPACFYAHQPSRGMFFDISLDLINSNFDFFGGGDFKESSEIRDGKTINLVEFAQESGYKYIKTKKEFNKLNTKSGKVIAIGPIMAMGNTLRYSIDQTEEDISLADFTTKAIELLDNEKGFFIMAEGGKIDWACHANDAATTIHEVLDLDNAVKVALKFYEKHPKETLIVVVSDHETGGMTLGFAGMGYESSLQNLKYQKVSFEEFSNIINNYKKNKTKPSFEEILKLIENNFGIGDKEKGLELTEFEKKQIFAAYVESFSNKNKKVHKKNKMSKKQKNKKRNSQTYLLYGGYEPITLAATRILDNKVGLAWTTYSHTGMPVPVHAQGVGSQIFKGYYDNTEVPKKIMTVLGVE